MLKIFKIFVGICFVIILTSCSVLGLNYITYNNGDKISKNDAVIFLSLTNSSIVGDKETVHLRFKSLKDGKTYDLEKQICKSKVFLGPLVKLFTKQPKDHMDTKGYCGNLAVGIVPEGKYKLEHIWIRSYNEGKYQNNRNVFFKLAKNFDFQRNNTYYLGNIDITILSATMGGYILDLDLKTKSEFSRDTVLLKKYYNSIKKRKVKDVSFVYVDKYREYDD